MLRNSFNRDVVPRLQALNYTGMATAFLLSNCHSMIIVIFRLVTGENVTRIEALGVLISLGGVLLPLLMLPWRHQGSDGPDWLQQQQRD